MIEKMNEILTGLKIKGECINTETHRHFAFYDIRLAPGTKIRKLESSSREIACGIKSLTDPIVKVLSKEGIVRLQVATEQADKLSWVKIFQGKPIPQEMTFPMLLGETDEGKKLWVDMAKSPHLLIAGATGSGKSVLLHTIIGNGLALNAMNNRKIHIHLVDPKKVEFHEYEDTYGVDSIHTTYEETIELLQMMTMKMEYRYSKMKGSARSVDENPLKYHLDLVVIDEVADLLAQDKRSGVLEDLIINLAAKARAAGIYLILATQRPSKDVFPTVLKANFGRIACRTASRVDSEVILDMPGAEKLLGRGDAILRNMDHDRVRFQVAYAAPRLTKMMCDHFRKLALARLN